MYGPLGRVLGKINTGTHRMNNNIDFRTIYVWKGVGEGAKMRNMGDKT